MDCSGADRVLRREPFWHFMASPEMDRYVLPGLPALNFVLHHALGGGGVASLRNDPQARAMHKFYWIRR